MSSRSNLVNVYGGSRMLDHLWFSKPPFYPLNYRNNDLERINGLNGDGQDAVGVRSNFLSGALVSTIDIGAGNNFVCSPRVSTDMSAEVKSDRLGDSPCVVH